jgi:integrase/recombinase XerD
MTRQRRALRFEEWPVADQHAWSRALEDNDPLDDPGAAAHWRPATRHTVTTHYGLWLAGLRDAGHLDANASPTARVTNANLLAYLHALQAWDLAPITIANQFRDLREALRVMEPECDLCSLNRLLSRLYATAEPMRAKRVLLVSPVRLLDAAIGEMHLQRNRQEIRPSRRTAERYRDALIISVLATRPIRLANLTGLELGTSFTRVEDIWWCRLTARETKDREPLEFPMPKALTPWLNEYVALHRPLLLRGAPESRLWVSIRATPMEDNSIYCRVRHLTHRLVGKRLNPHLFRDCAATFIAEEAPEQARIIARLLGHSTLATSEKYYNQANMLSAQNRYLEAIARIRDPDGSGSSPTRVPQRQHS